MTHCYKIAIRFRRYIPVFYEYCPDQLVWLQDADDAESAAYSMIARIKARYSREDEDAPSKLAVKDFEWEVLDRLY